MNNKAQKRLSADRINTISQNKKVSSLYSQYVYRTTPKNSMHVNNMSEKYKQLYENEKRFNSKILQAKKLLEQEKSKLLKEKNLFMFTIDTLMGKYQQQDNIDITEQRQLTLDKQNIERSKDQYAEIIENQQKRRGSHKLKKYCRNSNNKVVKHTKKLSNNEKVKALQILRKRINDDDDLVEQKKIIELKLDQQKEEHEKQIKKFQKQISELISRNQQIDQLLKNRDIIVNQLQLSIDELKKHHQQLQNQISAQKAQKQAVSKDLQNCLAQLNTQKKNSAKIQEQMKILSTKVKITQEQYRRRQQKQLQCVKILKKFTNQLQISDVKIQQFLQQEVGMHKNEVESMNGTLKTYQEYISYILHLSKKKQKIYIDMVKQFREKLLENELKLGLAEKRGENYKKWYDQCSRFINSITLPSSNPQNHLKQLINLIRKN